MGRVMREIDRDIVQTWEGERETETHMGKEMREIDRDRDRESHR